LFGIDHKLFDYDEQMVHKYIERITFYVPESRCLNYSLMIVEYILQKEFHAQFVCTISRLDKDCIVDIRAMGYTSALQCSRNVSVLLHACAAIHCCLRQQK
jgi:hypothetical protein